MHRPRPPILGRVRWILRHYTMSHPVFAGFLSLVRVLEGALNKVAKPKRLATFFMRFACGQQNGGAMIREQRIVTSLPLIELWDDRGAVAAD
jgi:hypothetical protein